MTSKQIFTIIYIKQLLDFKTLLFYEGHLLHKKFSIKDFFS